MNRLTPASLPALLCALVLPAPALAQSPANPCLDPERRAELLCPDLVMKQPFGLKLDRFIRPGRVVLRAGNSVDSVGAGPAELHGTRTSRYWMRARQRIHKRAGGKLELDTGARLFFKFVPGQLRYWKFHRAAAFALWRVGREGRRNGVAGRGPKVSYCLRDLSRTHPRLDRSPRRRVYPACNTGFGTQRVTLGTSVGWSDVYPSLYSEQWIDVTGLRGCFDYVHTADPRNGIFESDEANNSSFVRVRLPFRPGRQDCPRRGAPPAPPSGGSERVPSGY